MNSYDKLKNIQAKNNSILCVGLDTDISKIPQHSGSGTEAMFLFNKEIIDATKDLACSYKINFAFYEQYGTEGFDVLKKTLDYIPDDIFTIADAKRGDIGNTSKAYAKSCYEYFKADSITVNPYMGSDSVQPFLEYSDKMVFLLALTSNKGSEDFQMMSIDQKPLYDHVINKSKEWANQKKLGYVIGATHPDILRNVRKSLPENCLLIPGIGAQGGSIEETVKANDNGFALINVSRSIIYASDGKYFASDAREKALYYKNSFNEFSNM